MTCAKCQTAESVTQWPAGLMCWRCALMAHQGRGVQIGREFPRYGLFWEPGAGKTIAVYGIIADAKECGRFAGKTLVLAPKSILYSAWAADARHFPGLRVEVVWHADAARRRRMIQGTAADVLIITPESFKRHIDDFLAAGVRRLVIDEASCVKNHKSQISRVAGEFARQMESVYCLSGTPAPNNGTEYFGIFRCIDPAVFGLSFWRFANTYFCPEKKFIHGREVVTGWKPMRLAEEGFRAKLAARSWSLRKVDCMDLPAQTDVIREVELGADERRAYDGMLEELTVELKSGETVEARVNARLMKLRQITGGILLDAGRVAQIGQSKLDELLQVVEEIGPQKIVIWAQFTAEIHRIAGALRGAGHTAGILEGDTPAATRAALIEDFQTGGLRILVCQPAAAGHGITLTAASYAIYFSLNFSWETYQQSRDRIHRAGQRWPCVYFHLIARDTVDEKILWALRHKRSAHDLIMAALRGREGAAA